MDTITIWTTFKTSIAKRLLSWAKSIGPDEFSCKHCKGTGLCRGGFQDRYSCGTCLQSAGFEKGTGFDHRVACTICLGTGRFQSADAIGHHKITEQGGDRDAEEVV